ncbi:MAG TPA: TetR/AcrR family transcriptional regulator [Polyangiaceae bacterium]
MSRRAPRHDATPRRTPRRGPSLHIVGAILESATRILSREGYASLTTNRIADLAGVSIGSLYQYFPGKQAVIAALARQLEYRALEIFATALAGGVRRSLRAVASALIPALAGEQLGDLATRREILSHVPRSWTREVSDEVDAMVTSALAAHLDERADVREGNRTMMAFVIVRAVEAVLEAAVTQNPELLKDEEFLNELVELPVRYLRAEPG